MSSAASAAPASPWKDLRNGDPSVPGQITAEGVAAHLAPLTGTGGDEIRGRAALNGMASGIRAILPGLTFVIEAGPTAADEHLVARWKARGTHRGGFPGASPGATGRAITFTGTGTLRIADGKPAAHWLNADSLLFSQQLGVRQVPPGGEQFPPQSETIRRPPGGIAAKEKRDDNSCADGRRRRSGQPRNARCHVAPPVRARLPDH